MPLGKQEFKDFVTLQRGFDLPKNSMVDGPYPVVGSTSVIGYHSEYKVEGPGVVTGRSGSLGAVQYIEGNFWAHNTALWVKDFKGNYPRYVYYLLKTLDLKRFNSGVGVPTLNRNDLDKLEIGVHNFHSQQVIASILSAYDDLIENNNRRFKILEEMAQAIYKEWFVNFRFPGYEEVKMVKSELGMIPEGWEVMRMGDFGEIITGKTPSKEKPEYYNDDYMPFIKTPDMHGNMFVLEVGEYLSKGGADSQNSKTLPENSICVSCIGTVGIVSITSCPSQTNQQINSIVLKNESTREFLYFALLDLKETIQKYGATGATMANLNKGKFESLDLSCPNVTLLNAFHERVEDIFNNIRTLLRKNINLRKTRDLLLPKLISGEIDVENFGYPDENEAA